MDDFGAHKDLLIDVVKVQVVEKESALAQDESDLIEVQLVVCSSDWWLVVSSFKVWWGIHKKNGVSPNIMVLLPGSFKHVSWSLGTQVDTKTRRRKTTVFGVAAAVLDVLDSEQLQQWVSKSAHFALPLISMDEFPIETIMYRGFPSHGWWPLVSLSEARNLVEQEIGRLQNQRDLAEQEAALRQDEGIASHDDLRWSYMFL